MPNNKKLRNWLLREKYNPHQKKFRGQRFTMGNPKWMEKGVKKE
ncbi:hypothetical protein LCGC14_2032290 [marine sediment metagenome]|uniref:Uncharacterized protein n=1 Tax=marine sediment metagenome TaxID=412755 RepID=A0A0F9HRA0_9ZZZZ